MANDTHEQRMMRRGANGLSILNVLLGIWFFVSPWVFGAAHTSNAWNAWIVGAALVILAAARMSAPAATGLSWINMLLGIWMFASPWIFGYTANTGRFINSLCVGVVVFLASLSVLNARSSEILYHQH